jgi:hypothetical protein
MDLQTLNWCLRMRSSSKVRCVGLLLQACLHRLIIIVYVTHTDTAVRFAPAGTQGQQEFSFSWILRSLCQKKTAVLPQYKTKLPFSKQGGQERVRAPVQRSFRGAAKAKPGSLYARWPLAASAVNTTYLYQITPDI